jgi:hypothetical protein
MLSTAGGSFDAEARAALMHKPRTAWRGKAHGCQATLLHPDFCEVKALDSIKKTALHYAAQGARWLGRKLQYDCLAKAP